MSVRLVGPISSGVAAGSAGSATASNTTTVAISGRVEFVIITYDDSPPSTTDVVVATAGTNAPAYTLLTVANRNTQYAHPLVNSAYEENAGAVAYLSPTICDYITVTISQADSGDSVNVYLIVSD